MLLTCILIDTERDIRPNTSIFHIFYYYQAVTGTRKYRQNLMRVEYCTISNRGVFRTQSNTYDEVFSKSG